MYISKDVAKPCKIRDCGVLEELQCYIGQKGCTLCVAFDVTFRVALVCKNHMQSIAVAGKFDVTFYVAFCVTFDVHFGKSDTK